MKIGSLVHLDPIEKLENKLSALKEFGLDSCQLCSWNPSCWTDENVTIILDLLEKYGITPSAFWCGWEGPSEWNFYDGPITLGLVPVEYRELRIKNLCAGADFAKKLQITDVVTHMGFIPENPNDPTFNSLCVAIRIVANHLKRNGQFLLFETGQETPVTMLRCFEKVGTNNLGVNLDTANLILYGKANPVDSLDVFGKYVRNIHAKDGLYPVNGQELGQEVSIGEGKVDFEAFFTKLKELNYDSFVTIEREIEGAEITKDVKKSVDYLENIIQKVYGGK